MHDWMLCLKIVMVMAANCVEIYYVSNIRINTFYILSHFTLIAIL